MPFTVPKAEDPPNEYPAVGHGQHHHSKTA